MTNATHTWVEGEAVLLVGSHGREMLHHVEKITKSGRVTLKGVGKQFHADGMQYGGSRWERYRIRPLPEGMTEQEYVEQIEKLVAGARAEAEEKARKFREAAAAWWESIGKAMWASRILIPDLFLGKEVSVVRYTRHGETRMPFVIVEQVTNQWSLEKKVRIEITCGGLVGREYDMDGNHYTSISTYSSSTVHGDTLVEALYNLCSE